MASGKWSVVAKPRGKNPGVLDRITRRVKPDNTASTQEEVQNVGGVIIFLEKDGHMEEFSRVAFRRRNALAPDSKRKFRAALAEEKKLAAEAADAINELFGRAGVLR